MAEHYMKDWETIAAAGEEEAAVTEALYENVLANMEATRERLKAADDGTPQFELTIMFTNSLINVLKAVAEMVHGTGPLRIVNMDRVAVMIFEAIEAGVKPTPADWASAVAQQTAAAGRARPSS